MYDNGLARSISLREVNKHEKPSKKRLFNAGNSGDRLKERPPNESGGYTSQNHFEK